MRNAAGADSGALVRLEETVMRPLTEHTRGFVALAAGLFFVTGWGAFAWSVQLRRGLAVTGLNDLVPWGFYITNFVMFIGISHAGTFISAILRLTDVAWRKPVVRMAEFMTIASLVVGGMMPLVDLGRPDRVLNLVRFGRLESLILWDLISVTSYLVGSLIYLYIPLIPDIARCRDRLAGKVPAWRHRLYTALAAGWRDTPTQRRALERGIRIMCLVIIPVMISVHTVVSWIFAMTLRTGWHSTIFGPYFVVGAIYSGIAAVITGMAVFRRAYRLQEWFTDRHFVYLGNLLLATGLFYFYFTFAEYLTIGYELEPTDRALLTELTLGRFAPMFWFWWIAGWLVPVLLLALPRTRNAVGVAEGRRAEHRPPWCSDCWSPWHRPWRSCARRRPPWPRACRPPEDTGATTTPMPWAPCARPFMSRAWAGTAPATRSRSRCGRVRRSCSPSATATSTSTGITPTCSWSRGTTSGPPPWTGTTRRAR